MATVRLGGASVPLPSFPGLAVQTTGTAAGTIKGVSNVITLAASETFTIPSGTWFISPGPYSFIQFKDPVSTMWRQFGTANLSKYVESDGTNYRLANLTGCPVGAVITTGGTAAILTNGIGSAVNGLTITASSGGSTWQTVVGGAIGATIATSTAAGSTAGSGYTFLPTVIIDAPPAGGLQATAIVTALSTGTIPAAAIQVLNQGAGYSTAPNMTFVNDPRDTTGGGAYYVTTLTATGQLTGLYPLTHGTPLTGVPALAASVGAAAATAIMNFTVTAYASSTTVGSGYLGAVTAVTSMNNVIAATSSPVINPLHNNSGLTFPRPARIQAVLSSTTLITTGQVVEDGGLGIQIVPSGLISTQAATTQAVITMAVGGVSDTSFIQAI